MIELVGTVVLTNESEEKIRAKIREDVINEIATNGNYSDEIRTYLNKCELGSYYYMIESTIDDMIARTNADELNFDKPKMLKKLKTIKEIMSM